MSTLRAVPNPVTTGQANASFSNDIYKDKLFRIFMKATLLLFSVSIFLCLSATPALAADLEHDLNSRYANKILNLRSPLSANSLEFDSSGKPVKSSSTGPWSIYSRISVKKIQLRSDRLEIECKRLGLQYDGHELVPVDIDKSVKLTLRLDHPLTDAADAEARLGTIFVSEPEAIIASAPDFWHDYLKDPALARYANPKLVPSPPGIAKFGDPGVKLPKPLHTPEPQFNDVARKFRYQGSNVLSCIVNKEGVPEQIRIIRPLGFGLDEESVDALRHWRFQPGTKDGSPVAVYLTVEMSFNLR